MTQRTERPDIWHIADQLQMDIRAAQTKLVQLRALLSNIDIPKPNELTCPHCGLTFRGPHRLAEHLHQSHDGPVPQHWLDIEARAVEPEPGSRARAQDDELEPLVDG